MNKVVLITGAGGFIGRHLSNELAVKGYTVIGVDLHYPQERYSSKPKKYKAVSGDFRNMELMGELFNDVDVVFHLASAHLKINLLESEYWDINVHSLRPLIKLAYDCGVKRFVHVSSTGVYGNLKNWPADEDTYCEPQNIYGETKMAGEAEVKKIYEEKKFPIVILRPAWVYGPGCPRTLKIYKALSKGHFVMIGRGSNMRDPVYIKDVISALILSMESESAIGETIIVGGDQPMTAVELVESFCKALDLNKPKIRIPIHLAKIIAYSFEFAFKFFGKEPPVSRRSLEFFQTNNAFSIINAKQLLGYQPSFSFEQGLKDSKVWLERNA